MGRKLDFRIGVLIVVGFLARSSMSQEPAATRAQSSSVSRPTPKETKNQRGTSERISDAIKFANGLLRQRKFDLAADEFQRAIRSGATGLELRDTRYGLANARLGQGRYPDALRAFEDCLKDGPADSRGLTARYRVGELAYLLGDLPKARRELETYTAAADGHAGLEMAWTYLGDVYSGLNDPRRAKAAYEKSISAYPDGRMADRARFGLGQAVSELGDREQALQLFQKLTRQSGTEWVDRAWLQIRISSSSPSKYSPPLYSGSPRPTTSAESSRLTCPESEVLPSAVPLTNTEAVAPSYSPAR